MTGMWGSCRLLCDGFLVFVEFTDGQKTKLNLVEKSGASLERTRSDIRKEIQAEFGEPSPATLPFRSLWKSFVTRTKVK